MQYSYEWNVMVGACIVSVRSIQFASSTEDLSCTGVPLATKGLPSYRALPDLIPNLTYHQHVVSTR
jgi:hypothetical protein